MRHALLYLFPVLSAVALVAILLGLAVGCGKGNGDEPTHTPLDVKAQEEMNEIERDYPW